MSTLGCYIIETAASIASNNALYVFIDKAFELVKTSSKQYRNITSDDL